jgi:ATP-dependent DNA ligase
MRFPAPTAPASDLSVEAFDDGAKLLAPAERMRLDGIESKRRIAPYCSGECRDWPKVETLVWREANRERWRLYASGDRPAHNLSYGKTGVR